MSQRLVSRATRSLATAADRYVRIVEVGPRDGLQNEPSKVSVHTKVELIKRLARAGLKDIEVGSFVNPKNVPQMAATPDVLRALKQETLLHDVNKAVLVPNKRGMSDLLSMEGGGFAEEVSVFASASEGFSKANTNSTVAESLERLAVVAQEALAKGYKVRGYVSVVVECPFDGPTVWQAFQSEFTFVQDPRQTASVSKALADMGCYEVSLGDTIGVATPNAMEAMLDAVAAVVPVHRLAAHCHDTYNLALSNVLRMLQLGVRTVDCSIAGLGGCPNAPGAQGNVATEDVVNALAKEGYDPAGLGDRLDELAEVGEWISKELRRPNASRAGVARLALTRRLARQAEKNGV